jgi:hypothetical protein
MTNDSVTDAHAASKARKGLLIAIAASLVLAALAADRVPLFHEELDGVIIGISEVHDKKGSQLIAAVQLENGAQILVPASRNFLMQESTDIRVNEGRSLFGRKSYRVVEYNE